jgi:hypothetical protein
MALQDALSKIEEYDAIMQVPRSGLLGIGAFLAGTSAKGVAEEQLETCIETCILAQRAIEGNVDPQNINVSSALQQIFQTDAHREAFRSTLEQTREILELLLRKVRGEIVRELPPRERLMELADQLRSLSDQIKQAIPRDTYLTSLTGKAHPGFNSGWS